MRRLIRFIMLLAVFLAGYYLGHLPDSPDIFDHAARIYHRMSDTGGSAQAQAPTEDTTLTQTITSRLWGNSAPRPEGR